MEMNQTVWRKIEKQKESKSDEFIMEESQR